MEAIENIRYFCLSKKPMVRSRRLAKAPVTLGNYGKMCPTTRKLGALSVNSLDGMCPTTFPLKTASVDKLFPLAVIRS